MTVSSDLRLRRQKRNDAAHQDGEGQQDLGKRRQAQQAPSKEAPIEQVDGAPRQAQQLDHVDHEDQGGTDGEGRRNRQQKALGDVVAKGAGGEHARLSSSPRGRDNGAGHATSRRLGRRARARPSAARAAAHGARAGADRRAIGSPRPRSARRQGDRIQHGNGGAAHGGGIGRHDPANAASDRQGKGRNGGLIAVLARGLGMAQRPPPPAARS